MSKVYKHIPAKSDERSTNTRRPEGTKEEVAQLIAEIAQKVSNQPDKAALILTEWLKKDSVSQKKPFKKSA